MLFIELLAAISIIIILAYMNTAIDAYGILQSTIGFVIFILDISIHSMILLTYIKGLYAMIKYYFRQEYKEKYNDIDSRMDEQIIEASRYIVLFGLYIMIAIILAATCAPVRFAVFTISSVERSKILLS